MAPASMPTASSPRRSCAASRASNFRSQGGLDEYLAKHNIVGMCGIDTRALVRRIRTHGAMKGVLSSVELDDDRLIAKASVLKSGRTLTVCRSEVYVVKDGVEKLCAASQASLIQLKDTSDGGN